MSMHIEAAGPASAPSRPALRPFGSATARSVRIPDPLVRLFCRAPLAAMPTKPLAAALLAAICATGIAPGALAFDAAAAWVEEHPQSDGSPARSCASCHGRDLTRPGRHVDTGKTIEPLAPSANPQRLTDPKKIEKWLTRNCRWTLGRECTAEEKTAFVAWIRQQ